ncbi:MAG: sigma 54-interacting transcriptional regulator [Thermodesulfobacteriota bacterium]|nr:sigma 54-interacting transcriptional regulator [Thermodesulfobacteriota bacterium]
MMENTQQRILLVDDDGDLLRLYTIRLQSAGFLVETAESAEEALAHMPIFNPDLVISDLRMEGMDGMALFDAVQKISTGLPVIIITAHGSIPEAVDATHQGVIAFLPKPIDPKKLISEVRSALQVSGVSAELTSRDDDSDWRREIIAKSSVMDNLLRKAKILADSDASVLILGASGTGKELLARAIHRASPRKEKSFVPVNCAAIPEALLESELFGHAKGSFTGASKDYGGLFQSAQGGTLFLDEIGDMPLGLQVKLLRVLQERQVRPVGSVKPVDIDVRIISATHRNLHEAITENKFREDLYYRLNVVSLEIPELNERREDIPLLANHFVASQTKINPKQIKGFAPHGMKILMEASWPGNVRQLYNVIEQAVALSTTSIISENLLQSALEENPSEIIPFAAAKRNFEQTYLVQLLKTTQGNVSRAAQLAGRNRTDFYKLLKRHHIVPKLFKS